MNLVYVPCKDFEEARKIGRYLVENKLSVCVNIIPVIHSIFRWKGKADEGKESILIVKTSEKLVTDVINKIKKLHSYKQPTIISWKIDKTTKDVRNWILNELGK